MADTLKMPMPHSLPNPASSVLNRIRPTFVWACLFAATLLAPQLLRAQGPPPCPPPNGHISIDSGTYSSQPGVTFKLRHFTGALVPQGRTAPLCYLKQTLLARAEIYVTDASLTEVFSSKLAASGSKIKDFKVVNAPGEVTLSGKIVKVIPINFTVKGPVTTDGTVLMLHADKISADGIPVKALLGLIGEHLSALLSMKGVGGVTVEENTLKFAPEKIAHLIGHIQSVESTEAGLILRYGPSGSVLRRRRAASRAPVHPSPSPVTKPAATPGKE